MKITHNKDMISETMIDAVHKIFNTAAERGNAACEQQGAIKREDCNAKQARKALEGAECGEGARQVQSNSRRWGCSKLTH